MSSNENNLSQIFPSFSNKEFDRTLNDNSEEVIINPFISSQHHEKGKTLDSNKDRNNSENLISKSSKSKEIKRSTSPIPGKSLNSDKSFVSDKSKRSSSQIFKRYPSPSSVISKRKSLNFDKSDLLNVSLNSTEKMSDQIIETNKDKILTDFLIYNIIRENSDMIS